ncbi:MAG: hypothetical protein FH747_02960 [Stenotrophomonas sp.]|uniref:hypothetical protein n=1 Tax=Stenotrophomonas sp. TaxID=69392 RepID=UPI001354C49B|nr:hypothetical protein [Stenotrophomonas sp.]MTI72547.1 hypothetical protein [Stenotrophomonas sp.]MTI72607.1 hypothetical protein [Stenotrophomonas sp.]
MTEQQITEFDRWFEQRMDPELNLTPGDKELCRHAWQAALSHAEGEAVPVGYLSVLSDGTRIVDARQQYDAPEVWPIYTHPAPQVAEEHIPVPRALVEHWANVDAFQAPKGAAMELKTIAQQMLVNFDAKAPKTAPRVAVPEGYALVPVDPNEEMLDAWFTAPQGDSGSVQGFATAYRAMLAAAPTAPAGELVTRCTAGLGCDEKGYCDAAATGQGDLCDRRTMAHEQPVSDPDGLPDRVLMPRALTAENGAKTALSDEFFVDFGVRCARCGNPDFSLDLGQCAACQHTECEPNRRAVSWTTIKRIYSRAVEFLGVPAPDEREIAALLERIVPRIDPQNPKPLDEIEHCCECTLYYERERIHGEIARLRKLGGNHD